MTHGETGFVVDRPSNVDDVAAAIDQVLSNPEHSQAMRQASRRHAVESFSYDLLAARLQRSLESFEQ